MKTLGQIKKQIKVEKQWSNYKKVFKHKQMRLLFSKVALLMDSEINLKFLLDQEIALINTIKSPEMFIESFVKLTDKAVFLCDWKTFGKFIWYVYQTSTYWKDSKKGKVNIFTTKNYLKVNETKRDLYQQWINSVDKTNPAFNLYIIEISRMVF